MEKAGKDFVDEENWQSALELNKKGTVKDTLDNLVLIMRHDEALMGIAFNSHRDGIDSRGGLPWEQIKAGHMDPSDSVPGRRLTVRGEAFWERDGRFNAWC